MTLKRVPDHYDERANPRYCYHIMINLSTYIQKRNVQAMLEPARALILGSPGAAAAQQLPAETIAEYHAAGILRILQPRRSAASKAGSACSGGLLRS